MTDRRRSTAYHRLNHEDPLDRSAERAAIEKAIADSGYELDTTLEPHPRGGFRASLYLEPDEQERFCHEMVRRRVRPCF